MYDRRALRGGRPSRRRCDLAERFDPADVGVVVDAYHVWWDPDVDSRSSAPGDGSLASRYPTGSPPPADVLAGRGMMGDGVIDLPRIRRLVDAAGYDGPIEVEVINPALAEVPTAELIATVRERFVLYC